MQQVNTHLVPGSLSPFHFSFFSILDSPNVCPLRCVKSFAFYGIAQGNCTKPRGCFCGFPISRSHLCVTIFVRAPTLCCDRFRAFVRVCVLRPNSCEGMMAPTTESNCFATFYHPGVSTTHPLVKVENCEISVAAIGIFPTGEGFKIKEK